MLSDDIGLDLSDDPFRPDPIDLEEDREAVIIKQEPKFVGRKSK